MQTVILGAAEYSGLVAVGALQAYSGRAPLDLTPGATLMLGMGIILLAGAYAAAFTGLPAKQSV